MAQKCHGIQQRSYAARSSRQQQLRHLGPSTVQQFRAPWQPLQSSPLQQRHEQMHIDHSMQLHSMQQHTSSVSRPLLQPGAAARRSTAAAAAAGGAFGGAAAQDVDQKSELYSLIHSIPYRRLLLWAGVAAVGWQMHDFFGVSRGAWQISRLICMLYSCMHSSVCTPPACGCLTAGLGIKKQQCSYCMDAC
jgi:hypothetical protein